MTPDFTPKFKRVSSISIIMISEESIISIQLWIGNIGPTIDGLYFTQDGLHRDIE